MPTTTFTPAGVGATDNWTLGAGADKPTACQTSDGDTGYIYSLTNNQVQLFTVTVTGIPEGSTINWVKVNHNTRRFGTLATVKAKVRENSTTSDASGNQALLAAYDDYVGTQMSTRPSDAGAWTLNDLLLMQIGIEYVSGDAAVQARCSYLETQINYTEPTLADLSCSLTGAASGDATAGAQFAAGSS